MRERVNFYRLLQLEERSKTSVQQENKLGFRIRYSNLYSLRFDMTQIKEAGQLNPQNGSAKISSNEIDTVFHRFYKFNTSFMYISHKNKNNLPSHEFPSNLSFLYCFGK